MIKHLEENKLILGFVGGGNMASSMIAGLIRNGFPAEHIMVSTPSETTRERLRATFAVTVMQDNKALVEKADIVVLAVKPQVLISVVSEMAVSLQKKSTLIVSVAAGIRTISISAILGDEYPVARIMPNTPAMLGCAVSGLFVNAHVKKDQKTFIETIARAIGSVIWLENEAKMDVATAISGGGPAYFFMFMEHMQKVGEDLGLNAEDAKLLVLQTALGASKMAFEHKGSLKELRENVTSPNGTTEAALKHFEKMNFETIIEKAIIAATKRGEELSSEFGK